MQASLLLAHHYWLSRPNPLSSTITDSDSDSPTVPSLASSRLLLTPVDSASRVQATSAADDQVTRRCHMQGTREVTALEPSDKLRRYYPKGCREKRMLVLG